MTNELRGDDLVFTIDNLNNAPPQPKMSPQSKQHSSKSSPKRFRGLTKSEEININNQNERANYQVEDEDHKTKLEKIIGSSNTILKLHNFKVFH
jgi:hypothetical protein